MKENSSSCAVASSNNTAFDATVYFDGMALTVDGTATSATYNDDGTVTVKGAEGDIEISAAVNDGNLAFVSVTGDADGDVTVKFNADSLTVSGDIENVVATNADLDNIDTPSVLDLGDNGTAYADAAGTLTAKKDTTTPDKKDDTTTPTKKDDTTTPSSGNTSSDGGALVVGALAVGAVAAGGLIYSMMPKGELPSKDMLHVAENGAEKAFEVSALGKTVTVKASADTAVLTGQRAYLEQLSAQGYEQITLKVETSAKTLGIIPVMKEATVNVNEVLSQTPENGSFIVTVA